MQGKHFKLFLDNTTAVAVINKMDKSKNHALILEYFSTRPDPEANFIDGFTVNLCAYLRYLFPPFILLPHALKKIQVKHVKTLTVDLIGQTNLGSVKF